MSPLKYLCGIRQRFLIQMLPHFHLLVPSRKEQPSLPVGFLRRLMLRKPRLFSVSSDEWTSRLVFAAFPFFIIH